jgi:divalent metal cation (Fe/Co/Zn/Cd) transporter
MQDKTDFTDQLRSISILYISLIIGIVLFTTISIVLIRSNGPFLHNDKFSLIFLGIVVTLAVACLYLAHSNYNKRLGSEMQTMMSLPEKLNHYRSTLIKYMAFLEGPAILSIIGFLLTGYLRFIAITIIILLNMLLKRPSKMRMINDLRLNSNEQSELE